MYFTERKDVIVELLRSRGFVSFQELDTTIDASAATIRRDLDRLAEEGLLVRVHGGATLKDDGAVEASPRSAYNLNIPFDEKRAIHAEHKHAIGAAAAALCHQGEAVMIDGGTTTLQMCEYIAGLELHVVTSSLHIINSLLTQSTTRLIMPGGTLFREQNIFLSAVGEDTMPRFHAPRLFMGAAAIGPMGLMQADVVLVANGRRMIERADEVIILVDSSKFRGSGGHVVCHLSEIDTVITDKGITDTDREMLDRAGVRLIVAGETSVG